MGSSEHAVCILTLPYMHPYMQEVQGQDLPFRNLQPLALHLQVILSLFGFCRTLICLPQSCSLLCRKWNLHLTKIGKIFVFINKHAGYIGPIHANSSEKAVVQPGNPLAASDFISEELQITFQIKGALSICPSIFLVLSRFGAGGMTV